MTEPADRIGAWLDESGALRQGHFLLSAGRHSPAYVQCALLLERPDRAAAVGRLIGDRLRKHEPATIISPALGGLIIGYEVARALSVPFRFAERKEGIMTLRRGFSVADSERVAIVEDVVTTGKSTLEVSGLLSRFGGRVVAVGSILDRTGGSNPFDVPFESLMVLDLPTYDPQKCPLCEKGIPLDQPGSRASS